SAASRARFRSLLSSLPTTRKAACDIDLLLLISCAALGRNEANVHVLFLLATVHLTPLNTKLIGRSVLRMFDTNPGTRSARLLDRITSPPRRPEMLGRTRE